jgi:hypothetical protein
MQGVKLPQALGLVPPGLSQALGIVLYEAEHPSPLQGGSLGLGQVGVSGQGGLSGAQRLANLQLRMMLGNVLRQSDGVVFIGHAG